MLNNVSSAYCVLNKHRQGFIVLDVHLVQHNASLPIVVFGGLLDGLKVVWYTNMNTAHTLNNYAHAKISVRFYKCLPTCRLTNEEH